MKMRHEQPQAYVKPGASGLCAAGNKRRWKRRVSVSRSASAGGSDDSAFPAGSWSVWSLVLNKSLFLLTPDGLV